MTTQDKIILIETALSKFQFDSIVKSDLEVLLKQEKEKLDKIRRQYGNLDNESK